MGAFEEIVAAYGERPFTGHPSFEPQGDGYWSNGLPCATCGSISVVLDPVPACVVCTERVEKMRVGAELALAHLDSLLQVGPLLPVEQQAELYRLALMANVQVQRVLAAVKQ